MTDNIEQIRLESEFEIAEFLKEHNLISESVYEGQMVDRKHSYLFERASEAPGVYAGISFQHFKTIWNNFKVYPSVVDVHDALRPNHVNDEEDNKKKFLSRALNHYKQYVGEFNELKAKSNGERNKKVRDFFQSKAEDEAEDIDPEASVDPGKKNRKSATGNIEQLNDLLPGEVYADYTRIPKRRWGAWWKRYVRTKTSVEPPKQAITSLRKWTRHFILGYQLNDKIGYEIWYNAQTSTFSVHDLRGNAVRNGGKMPVMRDALNVLFQNTAQQAPSDIEFFQSAGPELKRVNLGLEREGQMSQKNAEQDAREMRQRKAERLKTLMPDEQEQDQEAEKARKNSSTPDSKDGKFNKKASKEYEERGEKERKKEKERSDVGQDNRTSKKAASAMGKASEKMKQVRKDLASRYRKAQERERSREQDDPANSQGSNSGSSQPSQDNVIPLPYIEIDGDKYEGPAEVVSSVKDAGLNPNLDINDIEFFNMPKQLKKDIETIFLSSKEAMEEERNKSQQDNAVDETEPDIGTDEDSDDESLEDFSNRPKNKEKEDDKRKRDREAEKQNDQSLEDLFNQDPDAFKALAGDDFEGNLDPDLGDGMGDFDSDDFDFDQFESASSNSKGMIKEENEIDKNIADGIDLGDAERNPLYDNESNQRVSDIRDKAQRSQYTRQMINNMFFEGLVKEYYQTRSRKYKSILSQVTDWFKMFRGRNEKINIPTNVVTRRQRIKGFFSGAQARSDFVIGFSIKDEINFEIWYVQEISSDGKDQYASFYVYDVTAEKIIKSNIPYYRNALSAIVMKIGKDDVPAARKNK